MVVVAIIGILSAIAYPAYMQYLVKSRRTAVTSCLQEHAQFMERYYTTRMTYVGAPAPTCDPALADFYTVSFLATPVARQFTVRAVPTGRQPDTTCGTLTINQQGARTPSTAGCW